MNGDLTSDFQLTLDKLLLQTLHRRCDSEIVYGKTRYTWTDFNGRIQKLASGLEKLGVREGSKVAVLDFDSNRYLEAYYAVPMVGAILHTVNIRLPTEDIIYTMAHARDDFVMIKDDFITQLAGKIAADVKSIKAWVTMSDTGSSPSLPGPTSLFYDDLIAQGDIHYEFPMLDENTPATIFYTSGTTGRPKGVWFTHRQLVLHTLCSHIGLTAGAPRNRLDVRDVVMPLVPFFHVHCWGLPFGAGMNGQKLVLAGRYNPAVILELISREKVTFSNMVPTVLNMILNHPSVERYSDSLSRWKVSIGGAALPKQLAIKAKNLGIRATSGYGLSETCPVLTLANPTEHHLGMSDDELLDKVLLKTGIPIPLIQLRVVDEHMRDVPRDSKAVGEIVVRGPWLTKEYFKDPTKTRKLWEGGWLHTGDLALINQEGYISIVDRMKDAIRSGGEWVTTIVLEDLLMRHPAVMEAAVIGAKDEKWGERPVAIVSLRKGQMVDEDQLTRHLMNFVEQGIIAKFWIPNRCLITSEPLPKTSTAKIDKKPLREKYLGILMHA
jgi:acyl-CoA synthetase (AMP-forming)/AMP-acid ligase II